MATNAGERSEEELREIGRRWLARLEDQLNRLADCQAAGARRTDRLPRPLPPTA